MFIKVSVDSLAQTARRPKLGEEIMHAQAEAYRGGTAKICPGMDVFEYIEGSQAALVIVDSAAVSLRNNVRLGEYLKRDSTREQLLQQMDKLAAHLGCTLVRKQLPPKEPEQEQPKLM